MNNNIFSYYTKYRENIGTYKTLTDEKQLKNGQEKAKVVFQNSDANLLKAKAKAIAEPLLISDSYEHEKAEDSETFYQTYNIELMSVATALSSLPVAVTKAIPFLSKHADKSKMASSLANGLSRYKNIGVNIAGKKITLPHILTLASTLACGFGYVMGMRKSMESQLGIIRKSSFDSTQSIINDPKMYAILTPEQEKQVNEIARNSSKKTTVADKINDKMNINTAFQAVSDYQKNYTSYNEQKEAYKKSLENKGYLDLTEKQVQEASEHQQLFENMLKNVELDVLEPLRKVETISNISYSALFTGGFLEYLITDKLVDVLKVQNKALSGAMKIGVPLLTYFLLNKNISDIENKAILATKYKHLKKFMDNPQEYHSDKPAEKQSSPEFIKMVAKDMKDYDKFEEEELPQIQAKLEAKKSLELTPEQLRQAKTLQKSTSMVLNEQRENVYQNTVGIKAFSETLLGPIDIVATGIGGFIGAKLCDLILKSNPNNKFAPLLKGLGAVATFIPAAILEAELTKKQKLAEKSATALSIKNIQDKNKFADYSQQPIFKDLKTPNNSKVFGKF